MNNAAQQMSTAESLFKKKSFQDMDSFFDHDDNESKDLKKLWVGAKKLHQNEIKTNTLFEGTFEKKGKKTSFWKTRYYYLTENVLAYKEVGPCNSNNHFRVKNLPKSRK